MVVARVLYLSNYGNLRNARGLPPLALHPDQRVMGGDIDRHHGGGLTGDEHDPLASDGYFAVIEAACLMFYFSFFYLNVSFTGLPKILLYSFNEIV